MLYSSLEKYKDSNRIAIIDDNKKYKYSELWKDSNKIAHWLSNLSTQNTTVGIMLDNCYDLQYPFMVAFFQMAEVAVVQICIRKI